MDIGIGSPFVLRDGDIETLVDPELPETVGPVLTLLRSPVELVRIFGSGDLEMHFRDGRLLRVPFSESYEAWELGCQSIDKVISLPGGSLAWWNPIDQASDASR